ncbi:MAG: helix-turn-helix domain-containing protein [Sedimentitalea sp.]
MTAFGDTLKTWRKARRFSQLDLALEAEVSSRHISFLETGRAHPSREMIARLGTALALPLASHNQMLTHAGFAARFPKRGWNADEMAPIRAALDHMLASHAPYPAFAVDHLWTLVQLNPPATQLFAPLGLSPGTSLLDLLMTDALEPYVANWPEVAAHSAQRLRVESAALGGVPELERAIEKLALVPSPPTHALSPVVPTIFRAPGFELSLFSTIAQFATPEDVTLDTLKLELFFPATPEAEAILRALPA